MVFANHFGCGGKLLHHFLLLLGFIQSKFDECLYAKRGCILLIYVDNLDVWTTELVDGKDEGEEVCRHLCNRFKMKELGELQRFIGLGVDHGHNGEVF